MSLLLLRSRDAAVGAPTGALASFAFTIPNVRGLLLCCTVALVAGVPTARAANTSDADRVIAGFVDANGDHHISYEEFVHSVAAKAIHEMNTDRDGTISLPEAAAANAHAAASFPAIDFSQADINGDGKISLEELEQALGANAEVKALIHKLDKDGDGLLSESELWYAPCRSVGSRLVLKSGSFVSRFPLHSCAGLSESDTAADAAPVQPGVRNESTHWRIGTRRIT